MNAFIWFAAVLLLFALIILIDIISINYKIYCTHKCPNCGKYMEFSHIKKLSTFNMYVFKCHSCGTRDEVEEDVLANKIANIPKL